MIVTETFFSIAVTDMARATAFYTRAFGAKVSFATPGWTSLYVAGVRLGLAPGTPGPCGLHFAIDEVSPVIAEAGGQIGETIQAAPGVVLTMVTDSEGNTLTLRHP